MRNVTFLLLACTTTTATADVPNDATNATKQANARLRETLPFDDKQSFADARQGFIAPVPGDVIRTADGKVVWDPNRYGFIKPDEQAPDTVNPSLWRQLQLVNISGLFKVVDRIYQVRNDDLSNMTVVEGQSGIIVVDSLISAETAKAALDLYYQHRPRRAVVAVI
jgi:alkyl sulfatase BDS1-like metallo-beta-lactamase superfamily hydrolase